MTQDEVAVVDTPSATPSDLVSSTPTTSTMPSKPPSEKRAFSFFSSFKNYVSSVYISSQALVQERKGNYDAAIELFFRALDSAQLTNRNEREVMLLLYNLAVCYEKKYVQAVFESGKKKKKHPGVENVINSGDVSSVAASTGSLGSDIELLDSPVSAPSSFSVNPYTENVNAERTTEILRDLKIAPLDDRQVEDFANRRTTVQISSPLAFLLQNLSLEQVIHDVLSVEKNDSKLLSSTTEESTLAIGPHLLLLKQAFVFYAKALNMIYGVNFSEQERKALLSSNHNTTVDCLLQMGNLFQIIGNNTYSMLLYEKASEINPEFSPAYNGIGVCLFNIGELDKATHYFKRALKHDLKTATYYAHLGIVLFEKGMYQEALKLFSKAFYLNSNYGSLYCYFALYYLKDDTNWAEEKSASDLEDRKNKGRNLLKRALEIEPKNSDVYQNIGKFYLLTDQLDEAIKSFDKAIELAQSRYQPLNRDLLYQKGTCCEKLKQYSNALQYYSQAQKVAPTMLIYEEAVERMNEQLKSKE